MKKRVAGAMVSSLTLIASTLPPTIIEDSLDSFIEHMVNGQYCADFKRFYQEELNRLKHQKTKRLCLERLKRLGLCSLEVKHPELASRIVGYNQTSFTTNPQEIVDRRHRRRNGRIFLIRCGMYEKFLKNQVRNQLGVWGRLCSWSHHVHNRISRYFSFSSKQA